MLNDIFKAVGPIVAAAMAGKFENAEFRFDDGRFHFDGDWKGVPLEELDLTADAPQKVAAFGPVKVSIVEAKTFRVSASGAGADTVRYHLREGKLVIARRDAGAGARDTATVEVAMPAPRSLAVAGSGMIEASAVADQARVSIAGSGSIALNDISCDRLKASLMGSGQLIASGTVGRLKLASAGSGKGELAELEAGEARLVVTGSGSVRLSSDGKVQARMMGSGHVTVYGRARCQVQSMGSGRFDCVPRDDRGEEPEAPTAPEPPKPPKSGGAAAKNGGAKKRAKPAKPKAASKKTSKASKKRKAPAKDAN